MFINRISDVSVNNRTAFKGFEHAKNDRGRAVYHFYFPFDVQYRNAYIEFYKAKEIKDKPGEFVIKEENSYEIKGFDDDFAKKHEKDDKSQQYRVDYDAGIRKVPLNRETMGATVDLEGIFNELEPDEQLVYKVFVEFEKPQADTGMQFSAGRKVGEKVLDEKYTLLPRAVTRPMTRNGLSYITMVDIHKPGARYEGFNSERTGKIVYDENLQKEKEQIRRNSANKIGGTMAGLEHDIPNLAKKGVRTLVVTPFAGMDDLYYHRYHNKNNWQMADEVGNLENFRTTAIEAFKNSMTIVFDGTFTSEGSEGVDVQYALRWKHEKPDALYRFRLQGVQDGPVGFGIIPKDDTNTRYKLINSPYVLTKTDSGKVEVVKNDDYNKRKPTYIQLYDATMVTEEQVKSKDLIRNYGSPVLNKEDKLAINTYQDITVPQKNQIFDLDSFKITLENAADFINAKEGSKEINTPEVAKLVSQTAGFEFSKKDKNATLWENKTGLFLRNHSYSGNDAKTAMAYNLGAERDEYDKRQSAGAIQNVDMDVKVASYWTGKYGDFIESYIAQTLKGAKTTDDIENLIKDKKLPPEVRLSAKALENIEKGYYELAPKGEFDRDETTVKALMELPLPTLEFAENTVSVLSQGFFFDRVSDSDLIGKTRFELDQMDNPHLNDLDADTYLKINKLFKHEIKNFADAIVNNLNSQLKENLIDENGEYTEFGEYLIEDIGQHIAKYAFLKSLVGDDFIGNYVKMLSDGVITYNYEGIRNITTLEDLEIPSTGMLANAQGLQRRIQMGMDNLNKDDVEFLTKAFVEQYSGVSTLDFRIAEAMRAISPGLDWRIDALKDVKDVDAVKDLSDTFDKFWDDVLGYYSRLSAAIAEKNPGSKIIGEITDMDATIRRTWGDADIHDESAMRGARAKYTNETNAMRNFWLKSGVTTEANYSDYFTSLFRTYAQDFEDGVTQGSINDVISNLKRMFVEKGVDFMRNLFTFNGNHDKPRVVHFSALDMSLYHNDLSLFDNNGNYNINNNKTHRETCMKILYGVDNVSELPLEIKLNINNTDYFRTVSSKAVAMCDTLKSGVNSAVGTSIKSEDKKYFINALSDLADGKYLDYGEKIDRTTIKDSELQNIETVITKIINEMPGNKIDEAKRNDWIKFANDSISEFSVQANNNALISERIDWIFEGNATHKDRREDKAYSAYIVSVLALAKKSLGQACGNDKATMQAFTDSAIKFMNKYDQNYINANSSDFSYSETYKNADRKNGFANMEFEETIMMLIEHAEYLARKEGRLAEGQHFDNQEKIIEKIYKAIHEPAMAKSIAMAAMLAVLVGMPAEYANDSMGQTGGEWKNNNVYNQNRNVIHRLKYEFLNEYRKEQQKNYDAARNIRNMDGLQAMNVGTPYMLQSGNNWAAWLMQSRDSMTISIMTGAGINNKRGEKPCVDFTQVLEKIVFPEGLLLKAGTEFECLTAKNSSGLKDALTFVVKHEKGATGAYFAELVPKIGKNIVLNKENTLNNIMILKRVPVFKGRNSSGQYNVAAPVYNTYDMQMADSKGQLLSVLSK